MPGVDLAALLDSAFYLIREQAPESNHHLCGLLDDTQVVLDVSNDRATIGVHEQCLGASGASSSSRAMASDAVEIQITRRDLLALADGEVHVLDLLEDDRLWLRSSPAKLDALLEALRTFVLSATAIPGCADLLHRFRSHPVHPIEEGDL